MGKASWSWDDVRPSPPEAASPTPARKAGKANKGADVPPSEQVPHTKAVTGGAAHKRKKELRTAVPGPQGDPRLPCGATSRRPVVDVAPVKRTPEKVQDGGKDCNAPVTAVGSGQSAPRRAASSRTRHPFQAKAGVEGGAGNPEPDPSARKTPEGPAAPEPVSRPAAGRSAAATSERMDATARRVRAPFACYRRPGFSGNKGLMVRVAPGRFVNLAAARVLDLAHDGAAVAAFLAAESEAGGGV